MKFTKMHGIGNDYVYINCFLEEVKDPEKLAIKMSRYHFGVGSDGLVLILPSHVADFKMRMFNGDGSEGKMCGNASRCIGKYVYEKGLTAKTEISLETLSGIKYLSLEVDGGKVRSVSVQMGKADFAAEHIPVISEEAEVVNAPLLIGKSTVVGTCVSMGNPHFVIFTDGIDALPLNTIGPKYEHASVFPDRINTEFAEVIDPKHIKMRVWERGSGETLACGTGACATVAAAVRCGYASPDTFVTVHLTGGDLQIMYQKDGHVLMKGPAEFVFQGEWAEDSND